MQAHLCPIQQQQQQQQQCLIGLLCQARQMRCTPTSQEPSLAVGHTRPWQMGGRLAWLLLLLPLVALLLKQRRTITGVPLWLLGKSMRRRTMCRHRQQQQQQEERKWRRQQVSQETAAALQGPGEGCRRCRVCSSSGRRGASVCLPQLMLPLLPLLWASNPHATLAMAAQQQQQQQGLGFQGLCSRHRPAAPPPTSAAAAAAVGLAGCRVLT
jgi:hypothetical protein